MLSLESFEQRLENPKAYYVFYEYFYKAAVGEVRWKECMDSSDERIGNDTTEAFALLTLANNCKAWLCGGKLHHGDALWTEHDSDSGGRDSIVDELLVDQEFVLGEDTEATLVLCDTTKDSYKKAVKERKDRLAKFRRLPVCAEKRGTWHLTTGDEEASENEPNCSRQDREKKRKRKHLKGLKKHTGKADEGERKFKGWSDNGHKAFVAHAMSIKDDVTSGKCAIWERAFREVHAKQQEVRTGEGQPAAMKYTVNRSVVWEL
jgi:hypothetical protein